MRPTPTLPAGSDRRQGALRMFTLVSVTSPSSSLNAADLATALRPLLSPTPSSAEHGSATEEKASGLGPRESQPGAPADPVSGDPASNAMSLSRLQAPAEAPALSTTNKSDEGSTLRSGDTDHSEARLAEIQNEHSLLLRKADAFMEQLFHRRSRSASVAEIDSSTELKTMSRQVIEPDQNPRLQPRPVNTRTFEQEADQPSLVIGNLTIEVTTPAPAPAAPRPPLVVVRGSGRSRNGVPSSRRFGLGQF